MPSTRAEAGVAGPAATGGEAAAGGAPTGAALTDEDVARGWLCGRVPTRVPAAGAPGAARSRHRPTTPRRALEEVLAAALERPPCLVAFSGGRDSSVLLAAAVAVARRRCLPPPVAVTERWAGVAGTDEDAWQERVVRHLRVADWERLDATGRVDLLGPDAAASLGAHGLLWPPLAHTRGWYLPSLLGQGRRGTGGAPGGTLVDGEGGDEVLGPRRLSPLLALAGWRSPGRRRPDRRSVALAARQVAPAPLRRIATRRELLGALHAPWLRPAARRRFAEALAADAAAEPIGWSSAVRGHLRRRSVVVGLQSIDRVIVAGGARPVHPLLHPLVVEAVAAAGGAVGYGGRTAALAACFGGLLPDDVLRRRSKATFTEAAIGPAARRFITAWDGTGLPEDLVDPEALVAEWGAAAPSALSFAALHAAWLAGPGGAGRS